MKSTELANYNNPYSLGSRMRAKRLAPLVSLIEKIHTEKGSVSILDVGGRETYWKSIPEGYLREHSVKITILNLPCDLSGNESDLFAYAVGNACEMPEFADNSFDIVHSNSVIEHVGNWNQIKDFSRETRRIASNLFIQTPYFWFPIEPHFIKPFHHWLPKPWRARIWTWFKMGQRGRANNIDEAMNKLDNEPYLLDVRMFRCLYPDCTIIREKFFLFTKSMVAFRTASDEV